MRRVTYIFLLLLCSATILANADTINPVKRIAAPGLVLQLRDPLLLAGGADKVAIYNIQNRANPVLLSEFAVSSGVSGIATSGDLAIVSLDSWDERQPNFLVVNIADPSAPKILFAKRAGDPGKKIQMVYAVGDIVYAGLDPSGLLSISVSAANEPVILGGFNTSEVVTDMISAGHRAYVTTWNELLVLDIGDPAGLKKISSVPSLDINDGLDIDGDILGVAEGFEGTTFYDISNPDKPVKLNTVYLFNMHEVYKISLRQKFCYIAVMAKASTSVFEPMVPGGLKIIDYERGVAQADVVKENEAEMHAFDVIAFDGYVYVAEDDKLAIFEHGPKGERPTATPTVPTPTRTPTMTPTPTNTPPFMATATKSSAPAPTFTPVPTPTYTFTSTPTKKPDAATFTPTRTPTAPPAATPTSVSAGPQPIAVFEFDKSTLEDNGWKEIPGGFGGASPGIATFLDLSDKQIPSSKDKKGLFSIIRKGEVTFLITLKAIDTGGYPALIRAQAQTNAPSASLFVGALKGALFTNENFDGSLAYTQMTTAAAFVDKEGTLMTLLKPDAGTTISPFIQIAGGEGSANVWIDRLEVFVMKPGTPFPE
ncbi:MAG: hypothetical protein AB1656_13875 [Candidatus Omnitrophota bacterium]